MRIEPLDWKHRALLVDLFQALAPEISNYSFANAYMFREMERGIDSVLFDTDIYLIGRTRSGECYLQPTVPPEKIDWERLQTLREYGDYLFPIPEEWVSAYEHRGFTCSFNRSDSDYLLSRNDLSKYPGNQFQAKRNLVYQFKELFNFQTQELRIHTIPAAISILEQWQSQAKGEIGETDYLATLELLNAYEDLDLMGRLTWVEDKPAGFIIGEPLNASMCVIHCAKADTAFKGIYQYLFQDFAQSLDTQFIVVNIEEDIGIPNLRKSKLSYHPIGFRHKYICRWN